MNQKYREQGFYEAVEKQARSAREKEHLKLARKNYKFNSFKFLVSIFLSVAALAISIVANWEKILGWFGVTGN